MNGGEIMNKEMQLLEALGEVDERFAAECMKDEKHSGRKRILFAAAAAVISVFLLAAPLLLGRAEKKEPLQSKLHDNELLKTSEKYESLEQLLQYLSRNETNSENDRVGAEGKGVTVSAGNAQSSAAATDGEYSYHCGESGIIITRLGEEETEKTAIISEPASHLLLSGSILAAFNEVCVETDDPIDPEYSVVCRIYDVSSPEKPEKKLEFVQSGGFADAVLNGADSIMLFTSDGQCACGYSSPAEIEEYVPEVVCGEKSITLSDDNTFILGEPTRISYIAVSEADLSASEVKKLSAVYGDIEKIFLTGENASFAVNDEIYNFSIGKGIRFAGKIVLSEITGLSTYKNTAQLTELKSAGNRLRIIGTVNSANGVLIYAAESDASGENVSIDITKDTGKVLTIDEIVPAGNGYIIFFSWFDIEKMESFASVIFADFADGVKLTETSMLTERVNGVDMLYADGSPYGYLFPTTCLGGDIYARFNSTPDGIDLFRLSGEAAECIYETENMTGSETGRFMPEGCSLGGGRFAAILVEPQSSEQREVDYRYLRSWLCVYSTDIEKYEPFTLLSKTEIPQSENLYFLNAGEKWYYVCVGNDCKAERIR